MLYFLNIFYGAVIMNTKISQDIIAKKLNLSRTTVYKVFKKRSDIKESTRQLVLQTAAEMNYSHPTVDEWKINNSRLISETVANSCDSYDIALVCRDDSFVNSFWLPIIRSIERAISGTSSTLRFTLVKSDEEKQLIIPPSLTLKKPQGIIIIGLLSTAYYEKLHKLDIPMVSYDISPSLFDENKICDVVMVENIWTTRKMAKHLTDKGLKRIAFAGNKNFCQSFYERWYGYHTALSDCNPPLNDIIIDIEADVETAKDFYEPTVLYNKIKDLLPLDAIICANDAIATAINMLSRPPYQLFDNIALTGFDGLQEYAAHLSDSSTVKIFQDELGEALGNQILWRIFHPDFSFRTIRLGIELILR